MTRELHSGVALLLSGGMDSTVALAWLRKLNHEVHALIFDYDQTLRKEVDVAVCNALTYGAKPVVVDVDLNQLYSCSHPLVGTHPCLTHLAQGRSRKEIEEAPTPRSYVPFRNGIFLAMAVAYGEHHGLTSIYAGCPGLDAGKYWDNTARFAAAFQLAAEAGTDPTYHPTVTFPWAQGGKAEVVKVGNGLGVDWSATWSCYLNGARHCGVCDSCAQRFAALGDLFDG